MAKVYSEGSKVHQISCCDTSCGFASYQRWIYHAGISCVSTALSGEYHFMQSSWKCAVSTALLL